MPLCYLHKSKVIIGLSLLIGISANNLFAGPLGYRPNRYSVDIKTTYFDITKNFNEQGEEVNLTNSGDYRHVLNEIKVQYDHDYRTSIFAQTFASYTVSDDRNFERENLQLSDVLVGADYLVTDSWIRLVPSIAVKIPLYSFDNNTDDVIVNDGVYEVHTKINIAKDFNWFYSYAYLGLNYRGNGRSSLIPIGIEVLKQWNRLAVGGGWSSYTGISDDSDKNNPTERNDSLNRVNSGAKLYHSVEPEWQSINAWVAYYVERQMYLQFGFDHRLAGENTASFTALFANLHFSFGGEKQKELPALRTKAYRLDPQTSRREFEVELPEEVRDNDSQMYKRLSPKVEDEPALDAVEVYRPSEMNIELRKLENKTPKTKKKKSKNKPSRNSER